MRVVSGIQPTGIPHLGNYFGAFENWIKLQSDGHECFFFMADQHAITMPQTQACLSETILKLGALFLAIGLDPDKSTLFVQSDVPEHTQLAWVLTCLAPMGHMERMIQFKEKSKQSDEMATLGLLSYPILQSADILLYKPDIVPVGADQAQHLELTRMLAKKFNDTYKTAFFPFPETLHTKTKKVAGLDGTAKMSKSKNNFISLIEDSQQLWKKLATAATDPARVKREDPGNPFICNIYTLHALFSSKEQQEWVIDGCQKAKIGCVDCKRQLFENIESFIRPIRARYNEFMQNPNYVRTVLQQGAKKARAIASQTLEDVYDAIGFKY